MAHDSFQGSWNVANGNGTNTSGAYSDLEMTNGGKMSLSKLLNIDNSNLSSMKIGTQKVLTYTSGDSGGHLLTDEQLITSSRIISRNEDYPWNCTYKADKQVSSFTISNAKELKLSTLGRYENYNQDYSLFIENNDKNAKNEEGNALIGNLVSRFVRESATDNGEVKLYDRSHVSGLINEFERIYSGKEDTTNIIGTSSVEGTLIDKTNVELFRTSNISGYGIVNGTIIYSSNIVSNGGRSNETREVQVSDKVNTDRILSYQSDGSRSVQASENLIATQQKNKVSDNNSTLCVFSFDNDHSDTSSPYQKSSAETKLMGVTSVQIESSGRTMNPSEPDGLNLEYRADIQNPIGFNKNIVASMHDLDNDGKFEDMNGNGRLDLNDLVILFSNYRWISQSNIASRIDYNNNSKADYADIVTLFKKIGNNTGNLS